MNPLQFRKAERYYHVYLQQNFFGGITVISSWGTFDSSRGGSKNVYCEGMGEVETVLERVATTRLKRGYVAY
jgi:hypothetical protein